ncbi:MAG TPA: hypothetical protein DCO86_04640 [Spirochaetaceae bacterium]|nr:hypothetical protein [Spirochaetaceae bacterium]
MGIYDETVAIPRKTMTLFFLIDCSGSMSGTKIGAVNQALEEAIPEIREISASNADAEIKIAALRFSSGADWLTKIPESAETFAWSYVNPGGMTDFGEACRKLNEKLSKNEFMKSASGSYAPVVILMSDGEPTDEYAAPLDALKQNNWFKKAIKVAIAVGDNAKKDVLEQFTGSMETVLDVHNPEALKNIIRFVSVTSSQIASKPAAGGSGQVDSVASKQDEMIEKIKDNLQYSADSGDADEW